MTRGAFYEGKAEEYLKRKGYKILEKNFRTPRGEIDIIGRDHSAIAFIEVKARHCSFWIAPEEVVTRVKQKRLVDAARMYIVTHANYPYRFDVVSIIQGNQWRIYRLFKNAFTVDEAIPAHI